MKQIQTSEGYCQNGVYYYYLKDHLGNTRVVINSSGTTVEKSHYYPFGMRFFPESTSNSTAIGYRYNGKEFETMNGLNRYDYGARFYDPALGRWHIIDNSAEKYYQYSTYTYAGNNPIKFIDPDGNDIVIWFKKEDEKMDSYRYTGGSISHSNAYVKKVAGAWNYNVGNGGGDPSFNAATNSNITINIYETNGSTFHLDGTVYWNPEEGTLTDNGNVLSPATVLDHELDHGVQRATNPEQFNSDRTIDSQYDTKEERRVITGSEQKTAKANEEVKNGKVTRTNHKGESVVTKGVTSTIVDDEKTKEFKKKQNEDFYKSFK